MLVGDFSIGYLNQMGVIYYNKNMMEEYYQDGDLLYKEVLDGTWTLDRLYELSSSVWRDLNGNNATDFSDQVGFCLNQAAFTTNHLFYDAGGSVCEYDSSGNLTLNGLTDRNIGITEKIYKLFFDNPGWVVPPDITKETGETDIPQKFSEGTMLFDIGLLSTADHLRDMKDDYGIIPYPKYDESIEGYRALVHDQAATFCLPITSDNVELCSAVMEEMAFQGYQTVVPEYYSVVLKQKYMRDDQNDAMQIMDMIHDSGFTDVGFMQNYNLNKIGAVCMDCISNKNNSYATKYAELITAAEEKFDTLMEFYNN